MNGNQHSANMAKVAQVNETDIKNVTLIGLPISITTGELVLLFKRSLALNQAMFEGPPYAFYLKEYPLNYEEAILDQVNMATDPYEDIGSDMLGFKIVLDYKARKVQIVEVQCYLTEFLTENPHIAFVLNKESKGFFFQSQQK